MYTLKEEIDNGIFSIIYSGIGYGIELFVSYTPAEKGEQETFSTHGRISWGNPGFPADCEIIEARILNSHNKRIMDLNLNHSLIKEVKENDLIKVIEQYINECNINSFM